MEQNPRKARQNSRVQDFDVLYEAQFTTVAIQLYAYFGDLAEAQDVTQEAFCRAWHRWSHIGQYEDPVAWIRRVAWRLAISRWRRVRTALRHMTNRPEQIAPTAGVRIDLIRALAKLPPNQRRAVVLRHLDSSKTTEQEVY